MTEVPRILGDRMPSPENPLENFDAHASAEGLRLRSIHGLIEHALDELQDVERINTRLVELCRDDLQINEQVSVMPLRYVHEIYNASLDNFTAGFKIYTGSQVTDVTHSATKQTIEGIAISDLLGMYDSIPIPITEDELDDLANNITQIPDDYNEANHAWKPAFMRMLVLYPELTKRIVLGMSSPESVTNSHRMQLAPELFAAHQIMARLIDKDDKDVFHSDGTVNMHYLR